MNDTALPRNCGALPTAIAGAPITLAGISCKTYVLEGGRRVIDAADFHRVGAALMLGETLSTEEAIAFARMRAGMAANG